MGETEPLMRQEPLLYTRGRHLIAQRHTSGLYSLPPQDGSIPLCFLPQGILDAVTPSLTGLHNPLFVKSVALIVFLIKAENCD